MMVSNYYWIINYCKSTIFGCDKIALRIQGTYLAQFNLAIYMSPLAQLELYVSYTWVINMSYCILPNKGVGNLAGSNREDKVEAEFLSFLTVVSDWKSNHY